MFLRPDVKMEPLIWRWYAWTYLIPPATAACNIVARHLKIMESYISAPELHVQAINNPKMVGGPFIDLGGERTEEIKELIRFTKQECSALIALNDSLKSFDKVLQQESDGGSLEKLYQQIPENLKGLIELVYDLNDHPSLRLIEALFYEKYSSTNYQCVALSKIEHDKRAFVMSTPRLDSQSEVYLNVSFADKRLDTLFSMRTQSRPYEEIETIFDIPINKLTQFKNFFTTETPSSLKRNYDQDAVRIRYFGHSCVLLQTKKIAILTDPVISYDIKHGMQRFTYNDLPDQIDYVLLTHNHQDHVLLESLIQLRYKVKHIVFPTNVKGALSDPSLKYILRSLGFNSLIALDELEFLELPDGKIIGLPFLGEHADLNIQTKLAYFIKLKDRKFLFAADSNNIEPKLYHHLFNTIGFVDYLFLGMECDGAPLSWLYGPLLSKPIKRSNDYARTLSGSNFEKAWALVSLARAKNVYIYAMGQEPWLGYIMALRYDENSIQIKESNKLIKRCLENGIIAERLFGKKELEV